MAKKEFTDISIEICEKKLHFKRVTNETLLKFSEKAEKEYNDKVKSFIEEVELLDDKRQSLEKKIALNTKKVDIIESKDNPSDTELDKVISIIEEIEHYEDELETVKAGLLKLEENAPMKTYLKRVDELLAEKVETLLEGITAKEFLANSDPVDTIKARNLEKYYQLCIVGERESKINQEIKDDVNNFLESQK